MNDEEKKYLIEALDIGTHIPLQYIPNLYAETLLPLLEYLSKFGAGISKSYNDSFGKPIIDVAEYALHTNYVCAIDEIEFLFIEHRNEEDKFEELLTTYVNFRKPQEKAKKYSIDFQAAPFEVDLFTKVYPIKAEKLFYNSFSHCFIEKGQSGGLIKDYDTLDIYDGSWVEKNIILLNTKISNSYLRNDAPNLTALVTNCNIKNSIVSMNGNSINDCKITDSEIYGSSISSCFIEKALIKNSAIDECEIFNKSKIYYCRLKNGVWIDNSKLRNQTIEGNQKVKGEVLYEK